MNVYLILLIAFLQYQFTCLDQNISLIMADKLKKKRSGHRLYVNNAIKSSKELIEQLKEGYDEPKVIKLESYRNTLRKTVDELKGLHDKILDSIDVESIESEYLRNCEFYSEIEDTIDKSLKDSTKEVVTENPKGSNGAVSNASSKSTTENKVKLPKLLLKSSVEDQQSGQVFGKVLTV